MTAGRKQYIYHPDWETARNIARSIAACYLSRSQLPVDSRSRRGRTPKAVAWDSTKVVSAVVYLLDETLIRIGNPVYAAANNSFGLTTLRDRHVAFDGEGMRLHVPREEWQRSIAFGSMILDSHAS
jgi:DNA topoisomerase I